MEQLEFANAQLHVSPSHSWGKISINFGIWDKSHYKYDQYQGRKAG